MKKLVLGLLTVIAGLVILTGLAFWLSPWPSVLVIRHVFSAGDQSAMASLEKHIPPGIAEQQDLAYGNGPNEIFDLYYPEGTDEPLPTIIWTHGGGWVAGSKAGVGNYLKILSGHGYTTVGLDYTVAPDAIYPTPVRQVNAALNHLLANADAYNIDPANIVLAGDSAGSQITAQVANIATSPDYAQLMNIEPGIAGDRIKGLLLFCGAYNLHSVNLQGDFAWFLNTVLWAYTGTKNFMNDPEVESASVLNYVTAEFPPTFITGGNGDALTPQSVAMANKLEALDVPVTSRFYPPDHEPALPHEYQFNLDNADGAAVLQQALAFLQTIFDGNSADTGAASTGTSGTDSQSITNNDGG